MKTYTLSAGTKFGCLEFFELDECTKNDEGCARWVTKLYLKDPNAEDGMVLIRTSKPLIVPRLPPQ